MSIEKRPKIARQRFGDWKADTMASCRGRNSCLAVFVEQKSRLYRIAKMRNKSEEEMLATTI